MPLLARTISRGPILAAFIAGIALASHRGAVADDTSAASAAAQKAAVEPQSFSPEQIAFFENKVRPILVENCYECHAGDEPKAQLRLVSRATILAGGESGPAITPGKPDDSLLVEAINYASFEMPPDGKLSDDKIATLTEWVRMGAPWPVETEGAVLVPRTHGLEITDEDRNYWAFVRSARPTLPRVSSPDWTRNRIDAFILAKLDERQLHPAPPVEPRELIRRAYLDLVGIPPTYEEIESLMADERPDSYERLLDQLLATPQYGERWGRHWLDVVRFGQTNVVAVSRLRDRRLEPRQAVRPLRDRAACRRPARPRDRRLDFRHRVLPARRVGRRARRHAAGRVRRARRHREHDGLGISGAHRRLRALPRSQIRPAPADRLLPAVGVRSQYRAVRGKEKRYALGAERRRYFG
jgi:hypothetical protein